MSKNDDYIEGKITSEEYLKWLNKEVNDKLSVNLVKKSQINPNLAFSKKKGVKTLEERITAIHKSIVVEFIQKEKAINKIVFDDLDDDVPF